MIEFLNFKFRKVVQRHI